MSVEHHNETLQRAELRAAELEDALVEILTPIIERAADEAAANFERTVTDPLTAAGPPKPKMPFCLPAEIRTKTDPVRTAMVESVAKTTLDGAGISYDATNPFIEKAIASTGTQIQAISQTTQRDVMRAIRYSYDQGLSVGDTAKVIRSTIKGSSATRARLIARTELAGAVNGASLAATQIVEGATGDTYFKEWLTSPGALHPRHEDYDGLDGQTRYLDEYFDVGDDQLMHPGDPDGDPGEVCNCRCSMAYTTDPGDLTASAPLRARLSRSQPEDDAGVHPAPLMTAESLRAVPISDRHLLDHAAFPHALGNGPVRIERPASIEEITATVAPRDATAAMPKNARARSLVAAPKKAAKPADWIAPMPEEVLPMQCSVPGAKVVDQVALPTPEIQPLKDLTGTQASKALTALEDVWAELNQPMKNVTNTLSNALDYGRRVKVIEGPSGLPSAVIDWMPGTAKEVYVYGFASNGDQAGRELIERFIQTVGTAKGKEISISDDDWALTKPADKKLWKEAGMTHDAEGGFWEMTAVKGPAPVIAPPKGELAIKAPPSADHLYQVHPDDAAKFSYYGDKNFTKVVGILEKKAGVDEDAEGFVDRATFMFDGLENNPDLDVFAINETPGVPPPTTSAAFWKSVRGVAEIDGSPLKGGIKLLDVKDTAVLDAPAAGRLLDALLDEARQYKLDVRLSKNAAHTFTVEELESRGFVKFKGSAKKPGSDWNWKYKPADEHIQPTPVATVPATTTPADDTIGSIALTGAKASQYVDYAHDFMPNLAKDIGQPAKWVWDAIGTLEEAYVGDAETKVRVLLKDGIGPDNNYDFWERLRGAASLDYSGVDNNLLKVEDVVAVDKDSALRLMRELTAEAEDLESNLSLNSQAETSLSLLGIKPTDLGAGWHIDQTTKDLVWQHPLVTQAKMIAPEDLAPEAQALTTKGLPDVEADSVNELHGWLKETTAFLEDVGQPDKWLSAFYDVVRSSEPGYDSELKVLAPTFKGDVAKIDSEGISDVRAAATLDKVSGFQNDWYIVRIAGQSPADVTAIARALQDEALADGYVLKIRPAVVKKGSISADSVKGLKDAGFKADTNGGLSWDFPAQPLELPVEHTPMPQPQVASVTLPKSVKAIPDIGEAEFKTIFEKIAEQGATVGMNKAEERLTTATASARLRGESIKAIVAPGTGYLRGAVAYRVAADGGMNVTELESLRHTTFGNRLMDAITREAHSRATFVTIPKDKLPKPLEAYAKKLGYTQEADGKWLYDARGATQAAPLTKQTVYVATKGGIRPKGLIRVPKGLNDSRMSSPQVHATVTGGTRSASSLKRQVMEDVGKKLQADPAFDVAYMSRNLDEIGRIPNGGGVPPGTYGTTLEEQTASRLVQQWAYTSSDRNLASILMQMAARDLFGIPGDVIPYSKLSAVNRGHIDRLLADQQFMDGLRSFLRAQYEETQSLFKAQGIKEVYLYRGANIDPASFANSSLRGRISRDVEYTGSLRTNPLSSWSTSQETARGFASSGGPGEPILMKAVIPVDRILSTSLTGLGCNDEEELVIIGSPADKVLFQHAGGYY